MSLPCLHYFLLNDEDDYQRMLSHNSTIFLPASASISSGKARVVTLPRQELLLFHNSAPHHYWGLYFFHKHKLRDRCQLGHAVAVNHDLHSIHGHVHPPERWVKVLDEGLGRHLGRSGHGEQEEHKKGGQAFQHARKEKA